MALYKVKVPNFEGPLDLLLFFIKRDELNIYDIPIAHITKEFLEYVRIMQMLDLELAGEFIVMAAMLMQIKVRMMLPKPEIVDGETLEEDPRAELVRRLIEYKRFKEITPAMRKLEEEQRQMFYRRCFEFDVHQQEEEDILKDVTMFDLMKALKKIMATYEARPVHEIRRIPYSIEEQAQSILDFFKERPEYHFTEILREMREKIQVVVTFIALLELIRAHRVRVLIESDFNNFRIIRLDEVPA